MISGARSRMLSASMALIVKLIVVPSPRPSLTGTTASGPASPMRAKVGARYDPAACEPWHSRNVETWSDVGQEIERIRDGHARHSCDETRDEILPRLQQETAEFAHRADDPSGQLPGINS